MFAIGGGFIPAFDSGLDPQLAHRPKHPLMIDIDLSPMQLCSNSPVAVIEVLIGNLLDILLKEYLLLLFPLVVFELIVNNRMLIF